MNYPQVRTRIAPSPTGMAHIGTFYQALFDWAWAKRNGGKFIVRIEDTDRERFVEGAEEAIYQALDWFGMTEDESPRKGGKYGPYRQSERLESYKKYALSLVDKGHAYWCDCSKERLEKVRAEMMAEKKPPMYDHHCRDRNLESGLVLRLKIPANQKIIVKEEIRGEIEFDSNTIDDQVLLKSDGFPTYHLAVVVDDHEMEITDIVRGEEWISSSPKHKLLYDYLGWEMPRLYHTPIIRNPDKSKMSKRHGHTSVSYYQESGYLPEAILNYLALLGWKNPDQKDVFSLDEFIDKFDPKDLNTVGPVFDEKKLEWLSGEYIRQMDKDELSNRIQTYAKKYSEKFGSAKLDEELVKKTIPLIQERVKKLADYYLLCRFFFEDVTPPKLSEDASKWLQATIKKLTIIDEKSWVATRLGEILIEVCDSQSAKRGDFFAMMRLTITGEKISPPLNESMEILGKEKCLERLRDARVQ